MRQNGDNSWAGKEKDHPCDEVSGGKWRARETAQRDCRGRGTEASAMGHPISTQRTVSQSEADSGSPIFTLN